MLFTYKARDAAGKAVKGSMAATSKEELTEKLQKMGYMATQINRSLTPFKLDALSMSLGGISTEEMVVFIVQLSNLINAGIPLVGSLNTLSEQVSNKRLKETTSMVMRSVEAGESLSQSLSRHPKIFPNLFVSMVKAGEASGKLDEILSQYAIYIESQADLSQKIKGALFYPIILLFAGVLVTLYIVTYIIPQFAEIFIKVGIQLPATTQALYTLGLGIQRFWYGVPLFFALCWGAVKLILRHPKGRYMADRYKLTLPLLGPLFRRSAICRFGRTFGMLVASGVPILQSLEIVQDITDNAVLARVLGNVRKSVEGGEKISEFLKVSQEFPPDVVQMIAIGEETGRLDDMLHKIADFYEKALGYAIKKLTVMIEPICLAAMGALVGFIMASMLLPMFDMVKILRH